MIKPNDKVKNIGIIVGLIINVIVIFGLWGNANSKRALIDDQVKRNTEILTKYNLELIDYKLEKLLNLLDE